MADLIDLDDIKEQQEQEAKRQEMIINDSWGNSIAGIMGKMDKARYTEPIAQDIFDDYVLADAYSGLTARVIDIVADDMTREWITYDDEKTEEILKEKMVELDAEYSFNIATRWARLFGGSLIYIGIMDGAGIENPVNVKKIRDIEFLKVFDRTQIDLSSSEYQLDSNNARYGKIERYAVEMYIANDYKREMIHHTRVLEFFGDSLPYCTIMGNENSMYWGASVLQKMWSDIRNMEGLKGSINQIVYELVIKIFKFKNLKSLLAAGNKDSLQNRMEIISTCMSTIKSIMIGDGEEFERNTANVSGLSDIIDRFMMFVSSSTGIPVTRLFGRSAAGMNATGEGDENIYYDLVRSAQGNKLHKPIQKLNMYLKEFYKIKNVKFKFNALKQLTEKEKSDIMQVEASTEKVKAETLQILHNMGLLGEEEIGKIMEVMGFEKT